MLYWVSGLEVYKNNAYVLVPKSFTFFNLFSRNQQSEYLGTLWADVLAVSRGEVPSSEEISVVDSLNLLIDVWLLVSEVSNLNLILLTTQTMVTTGILPSQGKSPWQSWESNPGPRDL